MLSEVDYKQQWQVVLEKKQIVFDHKDLLHVCSRI